MTDLSRLIYAIQQGLEEGFRQQSVAIASIGCGYCYECEALLSLFPNAKLTAIDLDHASVDSAHRRLTRDRTRFIAGDAVHVAKIAPGPYDFALIRHPDISENHLAWAKVFDAVVGQTRDGGFVMVLTFTTTEAEFVRGTMKDLPVRKLAFNLTHSPPVTLAGNDRYILLYHKY